MLSHHGVRLIVVSIGTPERGTEFVRETGFPAEHLFSDPENTCYTALRLHKGFVRTFLTVSTPLAFKARLDKDGMADLRDILPRWQPWLPPKADQGLQQGGAFVFKGRTPLFAHYDESTGAHAELGDVLRAAGCEV